MGTKSILFIDDNDVDNFIHKRLIQLTDPNIVTEFCAHGLTAIQYLKACLNNEKKVDLIFLDIDMPVMNGLDFLKEYFLLPERFRRKINLFVLTSSSFPFDEEVLKSLDFVGFLVKPLTQTILLKILKEDKGLPLNSKKRLHLEELKTRL